MEMNKGYKHVDTEEKYISLHDCYATKLRIKDNILSVYFGEGFWILDKHEFNDYGKTLKTDSAYVEFHIDEFDGGSQGDLLKRGHLVSVSGRRRNGALLLPQHNLRTVSG